MQASYFQTLGGAAAWVGSLQDGCCHCSASPGPQCRPDSARSQVPQVIATDSVRPLWRQSKPSVVSVHLHSSELFKMHLKQYCGLHWEVWGRPMGFRSMLSHLWGATARKSGQRTSRQSVPPMLYAGHSLHNKSMMSLQPSSNFTGGPMSLCLHFHGRCGSVWLRSGSQPPLCLPMGDTAAWHHPHKGRSHEWPSSFFPSSRSVCH